MADVLLAHKRALETGGLDGTRDLGSVESAIGRPYTGYYREIARKAAALVQSMAGNHGFLDGNKRTTVILTHVLLSKSGYRLIVLPGDVSADAAIEKLVLAVVRHDMGLDATVCWFKERICPL
jgi:death on curing protein